ncbi:TonB-dependent siderophore receptor [Xylophilus sp. Kf1]|nr:TonB-dependent siderophore receptor [Xylophilus sp. Kf1]
MPNFRPRPLFSDLRTVRRRRPGAYALMALPACVLAAAPALAQPAVALLPEVRVTEGADGATESTGQYTARSISIGKTPQSLRETPQSVSVITRQQLDDRNFTKVEDAVKQTTGVTVTRFDGAGNYNTIQSRGFDIGAIMLDGVPIPQGGNYATALDTAIYDRVEVLRGPAGLVQGGGEPGGSINLVRKRALGKTAIGLNLSGGSFGFRRADVDVTGALNEAGTLRGRFVGVTDHRDSRVATLFTDKELAYGTLELDITPSTTLSIGATRQRIRSAVDQGLPAYANGTLADLPRSTLAGLAANRQTMDTDDLFAELEHRLGNGGIVKLSARDVDRGSFYRSARANGAIPANGALNLQTVDFQGETRDRNYDAFVSTPFDAWGRSHRLVLGASRLVSETSNGNSAFGANVAFNLFRPDYGLAYPTIVLPGYNSLTKRSETALYGQMQISVTDRLRLLAGGRASWAEVETTRLAASGVASAYKPGRHFTPSVAAMYDLGANLTAYASHAEAFVVQTALDASGAALPPRRSDQVEVGIKGEFMEKRLQTHAALFRIHDRDRAVADPAVPTASLAGGQVRSQGLELEASGQPMAGWDLLAGYAYTETEYIRAPVSQLGQVFSPVTPRHMVHFYSRYALRGLLEGFSVAGGASWRSAFFAQAGALQLQSGNYALFNASVAYQVNDKLSVSLSAENLGDRKYYEKVGSLTRQNFYGEPRRVVVALKGRF